MTRTGVDSVTGPGAASCDVADSCEGLVTPFAAADGGQQKAAALVEYVSCVSCACLCISLSLYAHQGSKQAPSRYTNRLPQTPTAIATPR